LSSPQLTSLQKAVLDAFFQRESAFFLTGGAALTGFYLGHRQTDDLDLFTTAASLEAGVDALRGVADELGGALESLRTSPDFRRFLLRRGEEALVIDLVRDNTPQLHSRKRQFGLLLVDPPEEILANKLCALLSRSEIRDLVDLRALEEAGYRVEDGIGHAMKKDGGFTPAQLAWVLGDLEIGHDAQPPGDVAAADLREYLEDLRARLARMAFPRTEG
jgi:hypothetical protein